MGMVQIVYRHKKIAKEYRPKTTREQYNPSDTIDNSNFDKVDYWNKHHILLADPSNPEETEYWDELTKEFMMDFKDYNAQVKRSKSYGPSVFSTIGKKLKETARKIEERVDEFKEEHPTVYKVIETAGKVITVGGVVTALLLGPAHSVIDHFSPLENVVAEPTHNDTRVDDTAKEHSDPVKISGDGEQAYSPFAISESKVGHCVPTYTGFDIISTNTDGSEKNILNSTKGGNSDFDSDGKYVSRDTGTGVSAIDINTKTDSLLADEGTNDVDVPRISNGKIVYEAGSQVNEINVQTKEKELIAKNASMPDIFYDGTNHKIVYTSGGKIFLTDKVAGTTKQLNPDSDMGESKARIYGEYIIFQGEKEGDIAKVYLKNLKTGELKELGEGGDSSIHKNLAAWTDGDDIFVYDISKDKTIQIKLPDTREAFPSVFDGDKTDYVSFEKSDGFNNLGVWLVEIGATPVETNTAPTLENIIADKEVAYGEGFKEKLSATDKEGDAITYVINGVAFGPDGADGVKLLDPFNVGTHMCQVTPQDEHGAKGNSITFNITVYPKAVIPNSPPEVRPLQNATIPVGNSGSYLIEASDPDSDSLSYSIVSGSDYFAIEGNRLNFKGANKEGTYPVTYEVSDGKTSVQQTMVVNVDGEEDDNSSFTISWDDILIGGGVAVGASILLGGIVYKVKSNGHNHHSRKKSNGKKKAPA